MKWPNWVVPRGDWVEKYPSTNGKIIFGIRLAMLYVVMMMLTIIALLVWQMKTGDKPILVPEAVMTLFSMLGWFIGSGVLGLGIVQFVGKRATADPQMVQAISDAKVAQITAERSIAPQPVGAPHPDTPPGIVNAIEGAVSQTRAWKDQLDRESQAKQLRQSGTQFETEPGQ